MGHRLSGNVECTILEGKQRLLQEDFNMQIEKDLRIQKWKRFKNEEGFKKNGTIKMQSKLCHPGFVYYSENGVVKFLPWQRTFWGEIPKMTTA